MRRNDNSGVEGMAGPLFAKAAVHNGMQEEAVLVVQDSVLDRLDTLITKT